MMRSVFIKFSAVAMLCLAGFANAAPARIDLLMVYTPAALLKVGGADAVKTKITAMVNYANKAYARSDAGVYINLLDIREVNYKESGDGSLDINRIKNKGDGYLEEVITWRDQFGADVIGMMADGGGGVGTLPKESGDAEDSFLFWIGIPVAGDSISLIAHELGHVLGAGHHWDNPWNTGAWPYSHGQVTIGQNFAFADIMVSPGWLPPEVVGFPNRYDGMSNPSIYFDGVPTGIAEGGERAADNARTLRQMGKIVAAYRAEKSPLNAPELPKLELDRPIVMVKSAGMGASFSALVEAREYPSLQWQSSDDRGRTWTPVVDSDSVSGSKNSSLSISHVEAKANGRQFRLVATNNAGESISEVATLFVNVPVVVKQVQTGLLDYPNTWQEIVPTVRYIQAIDIFLSVTGNPPAFDALLETVDGQVIGRTQIKVSAAIPEEQKWVTLPFNVRVSPNQTYRLRLSGIENESSSYVVRWIGNLENPYAAGRSKDNDAWDMTFLLYGTDAPVPVIDPELSAGWHLLGNGSRASVNVAGLYGTASLFNVVRRWDSTIGKWRVYVPGMSPSALAQYAAASGSEVLSTIEAGEGYWLNLKSPLTFARVPAPPIQPSALNGLKVGWQMLAVGTATSPAEFIQELKRDSSVAQTVNVDSLWVWDSAKGKWYYYSPALAAQGGSVLKDYTTANGLLDFEADGKIIEADIGVWLLNK